MQPLSSYFNNKGQTVLEHLLMTFILFFAVKKESTPKTAVIPK